MAKAFKRQGFETTTLDIDPKFEPDILADILTVNALEYYDVIWASPPCQAFTVSQIGKNWYHDYKPKTDISAA